MTSPVKLWRNQQYVKELLGKTGKVITWTVIRVPPCGFSDQAPYGVVVVELTGGKRVTVQIVDTDMQNISVNMQVRLTVRRIKSPDIDGIIQYGIKAIPL